MKNSSVKIAGAFLLSFLLILAVNALFFHGLTLSIEFFKTHLWLVALLPLWGLVRIGRPLLLVPATWLSHFLGASVGRETVALKTSEAISLLLHEKLRIPNHWRQAFSLFGLTVGFASAFGFPLAAPIFALEHERQLHKKNLHRHFFFLVLALFASSYLGYFAGQKLIHHLMFFSYLSLFEVAKLSATWIACGFAIFLFSQVLETVRVVGNRFPKIAPFVVLLIVALLTFYFKAPTYNNLGLDFLSTAPIGLTTANDFLLKALFTLLCVAVFVPGGEFTPLLMMGFLFASGFQKWLGIPLEHIFAAGIVCGFSFIGHRLKMPVSMIVVSGVCVGIYGSLACAMALLVALGFQKITQKFSGL